MVDDELTLGDYLGVLRRRWFLGAAIAGIVVAATIVWSSMQTPMYRSSARLLINQASAADIFESQATQNTSLADRRAANEVALISSQIVVERAIEQLGFVGVATAQASGVADIIFVSAEDEDPFVAQMVVDAYVETYVEVRQERFVNERIAVAEQLLDRIEQIEAEIAVAEEEDLARLELLRNGLANEYDQLSITAELGTTSGVQVLDRAFLPGSPYSPQTTRNIALGGVLGLILGVGAILLVESLDKSVRSREVLESLTPDLPVLAVLPKLREPDEVTTLRHPSGLESEAFRTLRAALDFTAVDAAVSVVQITSAAASAGKTTIAANLAVAAAQSGRTVALVDGDLRRPRIQELFGFEPEPGVTNPRAVPGFTSAVLGRTELPDSGIELQLDNGRLWVFPSGPLPPGPAELLGSERARWVIETLGQGFDLVVIDSPPVLPVADALVLARLADATVMVVDSRSTRRDELGQALEALDHAGANVVGTVLNRGPSPDHYGYDYADAAGERGGVRGLFNRKPAATTTYLDPSELPRFEAAKAPDRRGGVSSVGHAPTETRAVAVNGIAAATELAYQPTASPAPTPTAANGSPGPANGVEPANGATPVSADEPPPPIPAWGDRYSFD